jgi:hypothetical protein
LVKEINMKSKGTGWKMVLIVIAIIIAVALMVVFRAIKIELLIWKNRC